MSPTAFQLRVGMAVQPGLESSFLSLWVLHLLTGKHMGTQAMFLKVEIRLCIALAFF